MDWVWLSLAIEMKPTCTEVCEFDFRTIRTHSNKSNLIELRLSIFWTEYSNVMKSSDQQWRPLIACWSTGMCSSYQYCTYVYILFCALCINQFQRCPSPPPHFGQPRDICSRCQSRGLGISIPRGDPWAFDTRVFERWMSLSRKTWPLSKTGLAVRD